MQVVDGKKRLPSISQLLHRSTVMSSRCELRTTNKYPQKYRCNLSVWGETHFRDKIHAKETYLSWRFITRWALKKRWGPLSLSAHLSIQCKGVNLLRRKRPKRMQGNYKYVFMSSLQFKIPSPLSCCSLSLRGVFAGVMWCSLSLKEEDVLQVLRSYRETR